MKFNDKKVPVLFQKINNDFSNNETDTRFMEVKIWLMHLGKNYNGSYFSKEVVEEAIPTLANTPILGFVELDKNGEEDFSDHRSIIVKKDGEYSIKYIGQAYGTIPSDNDAKFEKRVGDDGVEREYLTCKGLIWRKNDEAIDIFERDSIKPQSMELHDDFDGNFEDDGLFHFTKFKFFGACALGDNVAPAMESATIEKDFSYNKMQDYIQAKMNEFKMLVSKQNEKDEDRSGNKNEDHSNYNKKGGDEMSKLSSQQLTSEFDRVLKLDFEETDWGYKKYNLYYVDHSDTHLFAQSRADQFRLVGFEYSMSGDKPEIDFESKKIYKIEYTPVSEGETEVQFNLKSNELAEFEALEKAEQVKKESLEKFTKEKEEIVKEKDLAIGDLSVQFSELKSDFSELEGETKELREKVSTYTAKERKEQEEAVFAKFSKVFNDEDAEFVEVKEKASDFEKIEDLEMKLYTLAGVKALSSFGKDDGEEEKKTNGKTIKVGVDFSQSSSDVNPILSKYFGN